MAGTPLRLSAEPAQPMDDESNRIDPIGLMLGFAAVAALVALSYLLTHI